MKDKKNKRSRLGSPAEMTTEKYLKQLVKLKRRFYKLRQYEEVALCGNDLSIHVYHGIHSLAEAAGKALTVLPRNDRDYPQALSFSHRGITFIQLTEKESPVRQL
jgi:hypothetical protein